MTRYVLRCSECGKKLLEYDTASIKRYKSPIKKCKKCGREYIDPRCHEIAAEGIPEDEFSVISYVFAFVLGLLILLRGLHLYGYRTAHTSKEIQWVLPTFICILGGAFLIFGVVEIFTILTGVKRAKFDRLYDKSDERLCDRNYALKLYNLGYKVPDKYL